MKLILINDDSMHYLIREILSVCILKTWLVHGAGKIYLFKWLIISLVEQNFVIIHYNGLSDKLDPYILAKYKEDIDISNYKNV